MAFSIKKMFQKDKSTAGQVEQVQASTPKPLTTEVTSGKSEAKKQGKHGENGVCCGGCK